jgi:3-hydroxyisobutyrate dehydrogenase-like beta-hydroxyacid dehydrogenase
MSETIGFIGIGSMGAPMARNLLAAGYKLRVYNRTSERARPLVEQGAQLAATPAEVAEPGGIVITMLANDAAVEEVVLGKDGFLQRLATGGLHISMSTIAPATAERLAREHEARGCIYVAAPVFGRPEAAAARQLRICVSGPESGKQRARPILDALGHGVFDFGEKLGAANVVKVAGNFMIASAIDAMAEAFTLGEKHGLDRVTLADFFGGTLFASPIYQNYGKTVAERREIPVGFKAALGLKDMALALQTAADAIMPMPLAGLLYDRFMAEAAKSRFDLDWALALAVNVAEDAGLPALRAE